MFCEKCGAVIEDGSQFCEKCGEPVAQMQPAAAPVEDPVAAPATAPKAKINVIDLLKTHKKVAIISAAVLLVVVIGLIIILQPPVIDPADYLEITFSGYDGEGKLNIQFDPDQKLCYKLLDITEKQLERLNDNKKNVYAAKFAKISKAFSMTLTGDDVDYNKMSNGDKIYVRITVDREALEEYDFKFKEEVYTIELEVGKDTDPIPEPLVIDLFDILGMYTAGFEGHGELFNTAFDKTIRPDSPIGEVAAVRLYTNPDEERDWYYYINVSLLGKDNSQLSSTSLYLSIDGDDGSLNNGDIVKVTVDESSLLKRNGILLKETECNYTASGLTALTDINLFDYLKPVYSGFSNSNASVKWEDTKQTVSLSSPIGGITELGIQVSKGYGSNAYIYVTFTPENSKNEVQIRFDIDVDVPAYLKNGDTITISCEESYDRNTLAKYGMTFAESTTIVASGIEEPVDVDILGALNCIYFDGDEGSKKMHFNSENNTITFDHSVSGISQVTIGGSTSSFWSTYYYLHVHYTDSITNADSSIKCSLNITYSGYSSGDTVTIKLDSSYVDKLAKLGIRVTNTERIITIP